MGTLQYITSIDTTSIKAGSGITVVTTSSGVTISGTASVPTYTSITSTYTVLSTDSIIDCSTTTSFTVNLPTAVGISGTPYTIFDSSGVITVLPNGTEKINGLANYVLRSYFESIDIFSDGSNWKIR